VSGEGFTQSAVEDAAAAAQARPAARGVTRNTVIFSIATGLSRIAGLIREIVASSYFATSGAFSAFTIAFQVPNLVRSLFADAALSAAFVPVFTELLEQGRRRDAFRLASTLFFVILAVLGTVTVLFIGAANFVMPLFTGGAFSGHLDHLTAGLSRVLFPIVVLLGVNGLLVGILNAFDHFAVPAISPLVWNFVILVFLIGARSWFSGDGRLYAYAIGILIGTVVQLGMALPVLRRLGFRLELSFDWRDPRVKQVLTLMIPVTLGLGIINFDLLINSTLGSLISEHAPRAIDAAFRIYMLPQGMFSVAVATVLFPALSRYAARHDLDGLRELLARGMRQISLLLIPAAAATLALSTPITRLIYQHGAFGTQSTHDVSTALFWFSFSLPFSGLNLLLTRTFFSLQQPWLPTVLALGSLAVNLVVSLALYSPLGIAGPVIGTAVASAAMAALQAHRARRELHGRLDGRATGAAVIGMCSAAALLGIVAWVVWALLDQLFGRSVLGQIVSVGGGLAAGTAVYGRAVLWLQIAEARQTWDLIASRIPALRRA
jgi:putative peptidoglycan lipid II flippase